jgi:KamA family protein
MLAPQELAMLLRLVDDSSSEEPLLAAAAGIRERLNAHPGGQRELNVPRIDGKPLPGIQHKYPETVLFFPAAGQSCHSYCTYCFRWAQFTDAGENRFESVEAATLVQYLKAHPEVTDVLITGGDPLVMKTEVLRSYVEPLLDPALEHVRNIRLGTKSLSYWPHRFVTDGDSDDLLRLFEEIRASGRGLALMAHISHPREMETRVARRALRRLRAAGAVVRSQSPLIRGVNDDPGTWAALWRRQVQLGIVPYYMFVARDTGAHRYFKVPLHRAHAIYREAYRRVTGLARTARGPVMSATPGKVLVDGVARVGNEEVFLLKFIQGRDPEWVGRVFFASMDPEAAWLDDLKPAFGKEEFFFEPALGEIMARRGPPATRKGRDLGHWILPNKMERFRT